LKNAHLQRSPHPSSLRRTVKYASFLLISRALHLDVFDQPGKNNFLNNLLIIIEHTSSITSNQALHYFNALLTPA
jgi:hypothetical protein